jgi:hypothetical protein
MNKTLGEMTPAERRAAVGRALDRFQAELTAAAPAISRILALAGEAEQGVQDELALARMDDDGYGCAITTGPDTDAMADEITAGIVAICATRADLDTAERIIIRAGYLS